MERGGLEIMLVCPCSQLMESWKQPKMLLPNVPYKLFHWGLEQLVKSIYCSYRENLLQFWAPVWWFTSIFNSNFRESFTLCWLPQAPDTDVAYMQTDRQNTHTDKTKINYSKSFLYYWRLIEEFHLLGIHTTNFKFLELISFSCYVKYCFLVITFQGDFRSP